jgi:polysaccharide export outer membrane protein
MVYFQGEETFKASKTSYTPILKSDDYLSVIVTADEPETAKPFNFPNDQLGQTNMQMGAGMQLGMPILNGYLIDEEGFVDLPVLGRVKASGLSRLELRNYLQPLYEEYLDNPIVNIKIMNFRVSVLGDVREPGVKIVPNERISILEAIALAGDLNPTAERKNILVVREREGQRQEYRLDLTGKDFVNSPVYYLEQNDVVYVEPNLAARTQGTFWRTTLPTVISIATVAVTTVLLILN